MSDNNHDDRRKFKRILFDSDARIENENGEASVHLKDISLNGALVECPTDWSGSVGDTLSLTVQLAQDDDVSISMQTTLVHAEENNIGLQCVHIDIDSITNLRRLVELNLGDSNLLDRELEALEE